MNEPEKIDPRELSPLALAFVGDSVLELLVRQRLAEHHRLSAGRLNADGFPPDPPLSDPIRSDPELFVLGKPPQHIDKADSAVPLLIFESQDPPPEVRPCCPIPPRPT